MVEDLEKTIKEKENRKSCLKKEIEDLEIEIDRFQCELYKKEDEDSELEEELLSLEEKLYNIKSFNKIKGKILKDEKNNSYIIPIDNSMDDDFLYIVTLNIHESEFSEKLTNFHIEEYDLSFLIDLEEVSKFDNNIEKCVKRVINIAKKGLLTENRKRKFKKLKNEIDK